MTSKSASIHRAMGSLGEPTADAYEQARALARRFRHDPLLGDKDARLAAIRRRWYGLDDSSCGVLAPELEQPKRRRALLPLV